MQSAKGRLNLQNSASDAEHQPVAGDQDAGTTMDDLRVLERPTTYDMPADADATGSGLTSPVKKTVGAPAAAKANGMPAVKKVLNSGTSSTKPTGSKVIVGGAIKATAPVLKKSTTSPPAIASKPLASSTLTKPTTAAPPTRRMSVVPTKTNAPSLAKLSLSGSAIMKPSEISTSRRSPTGSARSPIATPIPGRPRASLSEAVKKPTTSRPSIASSAKPVAPGKASSVARSSAAPTLKSSRPTGSISSIKEAKEDGLKEISELKGQLEESNKSLESKLAVVTDLEGKIVQLEESLALVNAELDSKTSSASSLEEATIALDSLLIETREAFKQAQEELAEVKAILDSVTKELEKAKLNTLAQDDAIQSLQTQKNDLEVVVASSKDKIVGLEANHASVVAAMTETIAVERDAHLKVQAELKFLTEDFEAQKVTLAEVVKDLGIRSTELKEMTEAKVALEAYSKTLATEKEENANKVSELEVEILESKETQEGLEDVRDSLQSRVDELLRKLVDADTAAGVAANAANKKDAEHSDKLKGLSAKHEQELEASAVRVTEITTALQKVKAEYTAVVGDLEKMKTNINSQAEGHNVKLAEVEKAHADVLTALSSQLEKVSRNLNEQESIYNKKVNELNVEHVKLLEEAFESAKSEAARAHGLELQELRSNANSAIQQLQEGNRNSLEELQTEHASALETEVGGLNKQINKLELELKATQDDLGKAKASLEASRGEIELVTQQRDEARSQADAAPTTSIEQTEEISRLEKELEGIKEDLAKTADTLTHTKSSMVELSDKHANELEAAAKGRADEVLRLRAAHDAEIRDLVTQKTELLVKLLDLEGELTTAKATFAAHEAAIPKVNELSRPPSPHVPREELQKLHEAHNLKIHDMQAEHDKALKLAREELETATSKVHDLQQDVARKEMEIQYLEQDQEENQEHITRLKADLEALTEKPQPA